MNCFCMATSIHGVKYVTEEGRHWIERALWFVGCTLSVFGAAFLMGKVWTKYRTSPTITSVESMHYPIWNIPFPAVTVCNINKVHLSAARDLYRKLELSAILEEDDYYYFVQQLAEIIQPDKEDQFDYNITKMQDVLNQHNLSIETLMSQLTQPCNSLMVKCKWRGEVTPCNVLFSMHKADAGFCCSFNYHPPDVLRSKDTPPLHVNGAGFLTGLTMLLDPRLEDYYAALFSFYGMQVLVHSPQDYPDISARGIILQPRREAFIQLSAESTYCSKEVRNLDIAQRQCLFEDESELEKRTVNGVYSYSNCLMRCKLRYMAKYCNCNPYFYPATENSNSCELEDVNCLAKNRRVFHNLKSPTKLPNLEDNEHAMSCNCLPSCNEVEYQTQMTYGQFQQSPYDRTNFFKEVNITNHSIVHVFFRDLSSIRFRRDVLYTWNDLLASLGGILGLCVGCSLLSLLELIYFFTLRAALSVRRQGKVPPPPLVKKLRPVKFRVAPPPQNWIF